MKKIVCNNENYDDTAKPTKPVWVVKLSFLCKVSTAKYNKKI